MKFLTWIQNLIRQFFRREEPSEQASAVPPVPPESRIDPQDPIDFEETPSPNYSVPRKPRKIRFIIVHATGGPGWRAVPSLAWLRNPISKASAHYLIDKNGKLYRLVKDRHIAWHAGYGSWNGTTGLNGKSIGIELENKNDGLDSYPDIQLSVLMDLCIHSCSFHSIAAKNVLRHSDVDPERRTDPGEAFPWTHFRKDLEYHLDKRRSKEKT